MSLRSSGSLSRPIFFVTEIDKFFDGFFYWLRLAFHEILRYYPTKFGEGDAMPKKDTERLENELRDADDVEKFCKANEDNFYELTLKDYLRHLLEEKNLSRTQVVKNSRLGDYAYHLFAGRKKIRRGKIFCRSRRQ